MPITITINSNNAQALAFIEYAKKLNKEIMYYDE